MFSDTPRTVGQPWESDVALFIDWENLKSSLQRRGLHPDPHLLIEVASQFGRLVVAKAYSDWPESTPTPTKDPALLYDSGIDPIFVPAQESSESHSRRLPLITLKLSTDCLENSFFTPHIGTYILASGSYRFPHLIQSLRSRGYRVILIGVSWHPPRTSMDQGDEIVYYDQLMEQGGRPSTQAPSQEPLDDLERVIEDVVTLIQEQRSQGRAPLLSWLGHQLCRHVHGFNPQAYGFEKFKDLVLYAEQQGALKIVTQGLLDWALLPEDAASEEAALLPNAPPPAALHLVGPETPDHPAGLSLGSHPILDSDRPLETSPDVFADLVRTAEEIETDARYPFITPGFLGQCLWRKGHWEVNSLPPGSSSTSQRLKELRAGQIRRLVDYALEAGLLYSDTRYDPESRKSFTIVHLSRTHPFVASVLQEMPAKDLKIENAQDASVPAPPEPPENSGEDRTDYPQQNAG